MIQVVQPLRPHIARDDSGFTIVESMVALLILITGLVATFVLVDVANSRSAATRAREGATNAARQIAESTRTIPFRNITDSSIQSTLQAIGGLADARTDAGWQLERRGYVYTITTEVCAVDDPKDGFGAHTGKDFCPDSATEGVGDAQPEDFRRLETGVSWRENGATRTVRLKSTISSNGQAVGLPVSDLRLSSPASDPPGTATDPVITNPATVSVTFTATAPDAAKSLIWTVDGQTMTPQATRSTTDPTKWIFTWSIPLAGVTDGAYRIGAQAVDGQEVAGPERQIQLLIARTGPAAPTGVVAGYNGIRSNGADVQVVEIRWLANKEKSVTGYKVYRPDGSAVCTVAANEETACIDSTPPPMTATDRTYKVVALYRDPSGTPLESVAGTAVAADQSYTSTATQVLGFKNTRDNQGGNCPGTTTRDMVAGYTGETLATFFDPTATNPALTLCSAEFAANQSLPAQTIAASHYVDYAGKANGGQAGCAVTAQISRNGASATASTATQIIKASGTLSWGWSAAMDLAGGDRLVLKLSVDPLDTDCVDPLMTRLRYGGLNAELGKLTVKVDTYITGLVRPPAPTGLTVAGQPDGSVKLSWTAPAGGAEFYRIYRDGIDVTNRLGYTGSGTEVVYFDKAPTGANTYAVTAVNANLTESAPVTP